MHLGVYGRNAPTHVEILLTMIKGDPDYAPRSTRRASAEAPSVTRLAHSPWPAPGPSNVTSETADPLAHAASLVTLPQRTQLVDLHWAPAQPPLHAPSAPAEIAADCAPPAPLPLFEDALGTRTPLHLPPLTSCSLGAPSGAPVPIHILDCGAHIYDLLWLPTPHESEWLLAACASERNARSVIGQPTASPGALQLWELPPNAAPRLAAMLFHDAGTPLMLRHVSPGSALAAVAVLFCDGSVRLIDLPAPHVSARTLHVGDLLTLSVPHTTCSSIAWSGGSLLAAGCTNGNIAFWDVRAALASHTREPLPVAEAPVHDTLISALAWHMLPTDSPAADPTLLFSVGLDGSEFLSDVYSLFSPARMAHGREPRYCATWAPWVRGWIVDLGDNQYGTTSLQPDDVGQHHTVGFHHGRILAVAASPFHPFTATGSADGSVKVSNAVTATKRKAVDPKFKIMHKLYRLDVDGDAVVMKHGFFPEGTAPSSAAAKSAPPMYDDWDPSIGIHALAWCPNIGRGLLLASGAACGIARIDWTEG